MNINIRLKQTKRRPIASADFLGQHEPQRVIFTLVDRGTLNP
jgi:hypothetical protein